MFERFSDQARQAVVRAQAEARALRANQIGTEHVLLGLAEEDGVAAEALEALGVSSDTVRRRIEQSAGGGLIDPPDSLPFTPEARQALHGSLAQATALGHAYIGTGHILLSLLSQDQLGQGAATLMLTELGVAVGPAREQVVRLSEPGLTDELPPLIQGVPGVPQPVPPPRRRRWRR
jgi:ATP-dependent Clp protease ATP-binding subunit ClpC